MCWELHKILENYLPKLLEALRMLGRRILRHTASFFLLTLLDYDNFIGKKLLARSNFSFIFSYTIQDGR